mmetsp:Transcript_25122/g.59020  ORF Transcript_25122/g.59020 Transcript_25122/m.59020 type:complete len:309 (-) Transcript_25122:133-1059(-)
MLRSDQVQLLREDADFLAKIRGRVTVLDAGNSRGLLRIDHEHRSQVGRVRCQHHHAEDCEPNPDPHARARLGVAKVATSKERKSALRDTDLHRVPGAVCAAAGLWCLLGPIEGNAGRNDQQPHKQPQEGREGLKPAEPHGLEAQARVPAVVIDLLAHHQFHVSCHDRARKSGHLSPRIRLHDHGDAEINELHLHIVNACIPGGGKQAEGSVRDRYAGGLKLRGVRHLLEEAGDGSCPLSILLVVPWAAACRICEGVGLPSHLIPDLLSEAILAALVAAGQVGVLQVHPEEVNTRIAGRAAVRWIDVTV